MMDKEYYDKLEADGVSVFRTSNETEEVRDWVLSRVYPSFYISSIKLQEDGQNMVNMLAVDANRLYPLLKDCVRDTVTVTTKGFARLVENYCDAMINVEVDEGTLSLLEHKIYRVGTGAETKFAMSDGTIWLDILTGEEIPESDIFSRDGVKDGVLVYNTEGQTCTPGQLKRYDLTIPCVNHPVFRDVLGSWDTVTYGSVKILCDGSSVPAKGISQANARFSAFKAASAPTGRLGTVAYYMGSLKDEDGNKYRDGFAFVDSAWMAEALTVLGEGKMAFTPRSCEGIEYQCRPFTCKCQAEGVSSEYMNQFMLARDWDTVILERGKITEQQKRDFALGVKTKGKDGGLGGKLVIICDEASDEIRIDFFTDLEGLKAPYDPDKESMLELLDMSHGEQDVKHGSNTSTQLLQSCMYYDAARTQKVFERHVREYLEDETAMLTSDKGRILSSLAFGEDCDLQNLLSRALPKFGHNCYSPLWHSATGNAARGFSTRIRKLSVPTAGAYVKLIPDTSLDFGVNILQYLEEGCVEVICPVASRRRIEKLIAVKYPKMLIQEFLKAKVITPKEYARRVEATDLTEDQKKAIIEKVSSMSDGGIMVPAYPELANLLAGLDFDGGANSKLC